LQHVPQDFSNGSSTILRCAQASSGRSGTRHRAPTTPSAPPADPCRRAYLRLSGGASGTVIRASGGEDLVNSPCVIRRGVRVGRRSATGNRVGGVKPSRGFESHPLRFYVVALRRESQRTILVASATSMVFISGFEGLGLSLVRASQGRRRLRKYSRTSPASERHKASVATVSARIRLILSRNAALSLRCGNGSSGTSTSRNSHRGPHPSLTS
jgi:hypothetical protein